MNKQELVNFFHTTESNVSTNFPKFAARQMAKGWKITKIGVGAKADYQVEQVEPQIVDSSYFSSSSKVDNSTIEGEEWRPLFIDERYQISNMGRVRRPNGCLNKGHVGSDGYVQVSINNFNYRIHRLVLQTFNPREDWESLTVDHINGIRSDNRVENLRWATGLENTFAMLANRADMHKELTRIIQKYGYEETMALLQKL